MIRNLGQTTRILRLIAGIAVALIAWTFGSGWPVFGPILWIMATMLMLTAAFATCPAYRLFGCSSCPLKKK